MFSFLSGTNKELKMGKRVKNKFTEQKSISYLEKSSN